jgi:2-methylcitrate dehydratase PrpD
MALNRSYGISEVSAPLPYDDHIKQVAAYVYHYEPQSRRAVDHSRAALVDALGCAIESLKTNCECAAFVGPIVNGTTVPNGFKLPGTAFQLDPMKGAFDFSSMIRYLDHNDAFPGAEWGHPSGVYASSTLEAPLDIFLVTPCLSWMAPDAEDYDR